MPQDKDDFSQSEYHPGNQHTTCFFAETAWKYKYPMWRSDLGRILTIRLRQTAGVAQATVRMWRLRSVERRS